MAHTWINTIYLDLADEGRRKLKIRSDDLQEDRYLWDLVYNGIVHSVILGGARTNAMLHRAFPRPRTSTDANGADVSLGSKATENASYALHTDPAGRRTLVRSRGARSSTLYVAVMWLLMLGGFAWMLVLAVGRDRVLLFGLWDIPICFGIMLVGLWMHRRWR